MPDHRTAFDVCNYLERNGVKTWIAPRNIPQGSTHSDIIPTAIADAAAVVVIFSDATNVSNYVVREIDVAVTDGKRIVPVRLRDVTPNRQLRYLLGSYQWVDAYRLPIDVWRQHLLTGLKAPAQQEERAAPIERDVALSPALLLMCFVAFLLTIAASFGAFFRGPNATECSSEALAACFTDKFTLLMLTVGLFGAAILVPTLLTGRYRYRAVEWRDVLIYAVSGALMLTGVLLPVWSVAVIALLGLLLYVLFWRPWLNLSRARIAAGALAVVALAGSIFEGSALQYYGRIMPGSIVLFERRNLEPGQERVDYNVFGLVRDALETSVSVISVTPSPGPDPASFQRTFRRINPEKELGTWYQRSVLSGRPFEMIFTADVTVKPRCGKRYAVVTVDADRYVLGAPPFWAWASLSALPYERAFSYEALLTENEGIKRAGLVRALVAAHIVRRLGDLEVMDGKDGAPPPPLSPDALSDGERNVIADLLYQTRGRRCEASANDDLCRAARSVDRKERQRLLDQLLEKYVNTTVAGDSKEWKSCAPDEVLREGEIATRERF